LRRRTLLSAERRAGCRLRGGEGAPGEALSGDEAFHIGSMTKLFTAALIMQLDQEGVVPLATTIDAWFPEAPNADAITVQMLLKSP